MAVQNHRAARGCLGAHGTPYNARLYSRFFTIWYELLFFIKNMSKAKFDKLRRDGLIEIMKIYVKYSSVSLIEC